jgi:hypothetical protein
MHNFGSAFPVCEPHLLRLDHVPSRTYLPNEVMANVPEGRNIKAQHSCAESRSILTNLLQFPRFCGLDGCDGNPTSDLRFPVRRIKIRPIHVWDSVSTIIMRDILINRPLVRLRWLG